METDLPPIPAKRYFTIGEVGELCGVRPHVLRYWEQEFTQLRPMKRRGNRRYYQHHEVLMIRRIRALLYEQGFTISGARNKMQEMQHLDADASAENDGLHAMEGALEQPASGNYAPNSALTRFNAVSDQEKLVHIHKELREIRKLLLE